MNSIVTHAIISVLQSYTHLKNKLERFYPHLFIVLGGHGGLLPVTNSPIPPFLSCL